MSTRFAVRYYQNRGAARSCAGNQRRLSPGADIAGRNGPAVINSIESLQVFEGTVRRFLATVEERHGKIPHIHLFPAVPVTPAITLGRVLMPDVSPAWRVYDRDENNVFIETIEVSA